MAGKCKIKVYTVRQKGRAGTSKSLPMNAYGYRLAVLYARKQTEADVWVDCGNGKGMDLLECVRGKCVPSIRGPGSLGPEGQAYANVRQRRQYREAGMPFDRSIAGLRGRRKKRRR